MSSSIKVESDCQPGWSAVHIETGLVKRLFLFLALTLAAGPKPQPTGDLVVGKIERLADGLVIHYQNQGPGRLEGQEVSLRVLDKGREVLTIDHQPLPSAPYEVCTSQVIPFEDLHMAPHDYYALDIEIDPRDEIAELKEQNNSYFQQNNYGSLEEFPNFRNYAGPPRLVLQEVRFAAPDQLEVFVKNEGKGMTMATYACRVTMRGNSNNLLMRRNQPVPGQVDRWSYRFEKWGVHHGDRIPVRVEVDPDHWLPDHDRSRSRFDQVLAFGPTAPKEVTYGTASGLIQADGVEWTPRSSYATYVPSENLVNVLLFPFPLNSRDRLGLLYGEPMRVCKERGGQARFAQLKIDLWPGQKVLSREAIRSAYWYVGSGTESHSLPCDVEHLQLAPTPLQAGASLSLQGTGSNQKEHVKAEFQTTLQDFPQVAVAKNEMHQVPHQIPPSSLKGSVLFRGKRLKPQGAIGFYRRKANTLDLWVFPHPLHSEDMSLLKTGWITHLSKYEQKDQVSFFCAHWDARQSNPRSIRLGASLNQMGGSGTLEPSSGNLLNINAPRLGDGFPFGFRIRGKADEIEADLTGTATMLEVP